MPSKILKIKLRNGQNITPPKLLSTKQKNKHITISIEIRHLAYLSIYEQEFTIHKS